MKQQSGSRSGAFMVLVMVALIGIALTVWGITKVRDTNEFKKICKETVGVCVDYIESEDEDDDEIYYAIYEYKVNGETFQVEDSDYSYYEPDEGERVPVYYNPEDPREATTSLSNSLGIILIVVGLVFALAGLGFVLANLGVNESIIHICFGVMLILIGFGLPIATMQLLMGLFTSIFGVVGIIIVIKAITKLTGHEGGKVDQIIDEKLEDAGEFISEKFAPVVADTDKLNVSPIKYVPALISGFSALGAGIVFLLVGLFMLLFLELFFSIICIVAGIVAIVIGIKNISQALKMRKEYKNMN